MGERRESWGEEGYGPEVVHAGGWALNTAPLGFMEGSKATYMDS